MAASKISSTSAVVGRRLRRFLGTLLTLGFGVAWLSFERPATVEAAVPVIAANAPLRVVSPPMHVVAVAMITPPREAARRVTPPRRPIRPRPRPVAHRVTKVPFVIVTPPVTKPPPQTDVPPVVETPPVIDPTPVVEMPPVVETPPMVETPPVIETTPVVDEPIRIPIRTRSS